jgi:membrane dipeptidase
VDTIADLPKLSGILATRGYSPDDVELIMSGNVIRFLRETWR